MALCSISNVSMFPLIADVYYAVTEQDAYGSVKKQWVFAKPVSCKLSVPNQVSDENIKPAMKINQELMLEGAVMEDLRVSADDMYSMTNIVITNVRNNLNVEIYKETSGPRKGSSTIFEVAALTPSTGPFGDIDYYNVILRRSENQAVDI